MQRLEGADDVTHHDTLLVELAGRQTQVHMHAVNASWLAMAKSYTAVHTLSLI